MKVRDHTGRDQARHVDDWLITYADTVTLLLCLFVVILSSHGTVRAVPPPVPPVMVAAAMAPEPPFPPRIFDPPIQEDAMEAQAPAEQAVPVVVARVEPVAIVEPPPVSTKAAEPPGHRITMLQIGSAAFFGSGNATLSAAGRSLLNEVAVSLRSEKFAAYHVTVEGHTDDAPINTPQFQSNWELSAARAASVVRYLLEQGVAASRLTAAGYADTFPLAPNRTADGTVIAENQARNRRVVIRLEKIDRPDG